jgi:hypothetical protein
VAKSKTVLSSNGKLLEIKRENRLRHHYHLPKRARLVPLEKTTSLVTPRPRWPSSSQAVH